MTYRLLALDIDGTLLDRQTDIPLTERTKRAIGSVLETGAGVTLATGRTSNSAIPFSRDPGPNPAHNFLPGLPDVQPRHQ